MEKKQILFASKESFLHTTAERLRAEGYECACALDTRATVDMLRAVDYDLLVADVKVAEELSPKRIKSLTSSGVQLPVILIGTGLPVRWTGRSVAHLTNSFSVSDLLTEIRRALEHPSASPAAPPDRRPDAPACYGEAETTVPQGPSIPALGTLTPDLLRDLIDAVKTLKQLIEALTARKELFTHRMAPSREGAATAILGEGGDVKEFDLGTWSPSLQEALTLLSPREREILRRFYLHRQRVTAIARDLYISPHTVRNHLKSIFRKLRVNSQIELITLLGQNTPEH